MSLGLKVVKSINDRTLVFVGGSWEEDDGT